MNLATIKYVLVQFVCCNPKKHINIPSNGKRNGPASDVNKDLETRISKQLFKLSKLKNWQAWYTTVGVRPRQNTLMNELAELSPCD